MTNYVSSKASRFFMDHVANSSSEWSLENVYDGLFDYCFPDDFKAMLRRRLMTAQQGSSRVRDYVREIEHLASRFRDITEFQLVQIFWQGLNGYLQVKLIEKGLGPETTALDRLVKHAVQKEKAHIEARKLQREFEGQVPGRTWGRFQNQTTGPAPYQPQRPDPRGPPPNQASGSRQGDYRNNKSQSHAQNNGGSQGQNNGQRDRQNQQNNKQSGQNGDKKAPPRKHQTVHTPEKLAELVSGTPQCFTCEQLGHISRNCPQRQKVRAPNVQLGAGSVRFEHLEDLADKA
ncbi:transcription factor [Ganoderma sinense ZZ0214-1]|uniref:Transcription factor n=1 Tax=Ganoderma sinense ZZ0214-1 TaxID=1077348 RepID=A0A2G8S2X6_9APHY|nr:transcription factor [Ganoderma sinense ZZ0214-1]